MEGRKTIRSLLARLGRWRVVLYLLVALGLLEAGVRWQAATWCSYSPEYYRDRVDVCRRFHPDMLIVGASPVIGAVSGQIVSSLHFEGAELRRIFNLGLPLATTPDVLHALNRVIATRPRLIVYGITPADMNASRRVPQGVQYLVNARELIETMNALPGRGPWLAGMYVSGAARSAWALHEHARGIRRCLAIHLNEMCPSLCMETAREAREALVIHEELRAPLGLEPTFPAPTERCYAHLKARGNHPTYFPYFDRFDVAGYQPFLHRIIDLCEEHDVPLVLVRMPATADLEERLHPEPYAQLDDVLARLEAERGIRLLTPTRAEIGLGDADFADYIHFNADGARKFSAWLKSALGACKRR